MSNRGLRMTEEAYAARQQRKEFNRTLVEVVKDLSPQIASNGELTTSLMKEFAATAKTPKYRNVKTEVDGIKFDSKKEAARYSELKLLEKAGEITNLKLQVKFPLVINGQLVCSYVADFIYYNRAKELVVEDVKSEATRKNRAYRIKNKLFRAFHGTEITEL